MRVGSIDRQSLTESGRLDAPFFLSEGNLASLAIQKVVSTGKWKTERLGDIASVVLPPRFKRRYADPADGVPYLRPYDIFEFAPGPADFLAQGDYLDAYRIHPFTILQTCSGRNLGPAVMTDAYLAGFCLSHDLVRITADDVDLLFYLIAFLNTRFGQALLRRDKTGSVIDHIDHHQVANLTVPIPPKRLRNTIVRRFQQAFELRSDARAILATTQEGFETELEERIGSVRSTSTWSIAKSSLARRIDAAPYEPSLARIREGLLRTGGKPLTEMVEARKPAGRYKTSYVEREYGRPMLSGAQIHQVRPIAPKFITEAALRNVAQYELRSGWIVYQADGRAEKGLGKPSIVQPSRDRWLASGHVGRLVPNPDIDVGWLFVAFRSEYVQRQVRAQASGSVVDATFPADMQSVVMPRPASLPEIWGAWVAMDESTRLEDEAIAILESGLSPEND